ncbi:MAG: fibronectin type III domain-containing protein [Nitrospirae bacterium]|nr:fibronectin type III domain-containing protein [Nitrospirota bacterium]
MTLNSCGNGGGSETVGSDNSAKLSWDPPTTNADGTSLTDLAGFKIYYGTSSGIYTEMVEIANLQTIEYTIENLTPATYYFAVTAYDTAGNKSDYSNEVSKVIQ